MTKPFAYTQAYEGHLPISGQSRRNRKQRVLQLSRRLDTFVYIRSIRHRIVLVCAVIRCYPGASAHTLSFNTAKLTVHDPENVEVLEICCLAARRQCVCAVAKEVLSHLVVSDGPHVLFWSVDAAA
jgi:hypothetical protein